MNLLRVGIVMAAVVAATGVHAQEPAPGGALRVIVAAEEEPETFASAPGAGFERELLEGFAKLRGLRLEVVRAPGYGDRIPMLLDRRGDVIVAIFDTPERRRQVAFTSEVMPTFNVIVTKRGQPSPKTMGEAKAVRVAVIKDTQPAKTAAEAGLSLVTLERKAELVDGLRTGRLPAAVMSVSEFALAKKEASELEAGLRVGQATSVAWATRPGDVNLRDALDQYLTSVRRTATWSRLLVKYFGEDALVVLGRR
jgi:polar amino acid transport system substrate-binding protein